MSGFRQKSKQKGKWAFVKYYGDGAIYAVCQNCGFTQRDAYDVENFKCTINLNKLYKYCPSCGLKMTLYNGEHIYRIKDGEVIE